MDQQKTAKGTFVETFTASGLKVRGQLEEQGALTSSGGLPNVLLCKAVTSGADASPQAGTEEDAQGRLSQRLVNPAETVLLPGLSQGRLYAEPIADEEQVGAPGGGATGRGAENSSAARGQ